MNDVRYKCNRCGTTLMRGRVATAEQSYSPPGVRIDFYCPCKPDLLWNVYPFVPPALKDLFGGPVSLPWKNPSPPMSKEDIDNAVEAWSWELEQLDIAASVTDLPTRTLAVAGPDVEDFLWWVDHSRVSPLGDDAVPPSPPPGEPG